MPLSSGVSAWSCSPVSACSRGVRVSGVELNKVPLADEIGHRRALEVLCPPERRAVVEVILDVWVGPLIEQDAHHHRAAPLRRQVQRGDAFAVVWPAERRPPVDSCAMIEQPKAAALAAYPDLNTSNILHKWQLAYADTWRSFLRPDMVDVMEMTLPTKRQMSCSSARSPWDVRLYPMRAPFPRRLASRGQRASTTAIIIQPVVLPIMGRIWRAGGMSTLR